MARNAIVVGAGIAGLATARALAVQGYSVKVFERNGIASGASVRNFGMIWPVGQPDGVAYETAMRSRRIWESLCRDAGIWFETCGSLHLAYHEDEWQVLQELKGAYPERPLRLLTNGEVNKISVNAVSEGLLGGLYSDTEMIVDPRDAIAKIPGYLTSKYAVEFHWNEPVTAISLPDVTTSKGTYATQEVFVCSGVDFETLYPEHYAAAPITRCKLQMMQLSAQEARMGPALCGGLSLGHYKSFEAAPSLGKLKNRYDLEYPEYKKYGIHVMVSQNQSGQFTIGDSHEYGPHPDPFDKAGINKLILNYLGTFAGFHNATVMESWHGIYPKLTNGESWLLMRPAPGVTVVNGFGGAGMTLAFGMADRLID
ncbi:MAG: TIGR03364 family FAD-dependent oxidoreductase [Chitinophagaceae bacterium]|nr:MAG: TIGR03364 family FAD-dependent oxidoreductase [Chitinophagaceae bacterium]